MQKQVELVLRSRSGGYVEGEVGEFGALGSVKSLKFDGERTRGSQRGKWDPSPCHIHSISMCLCKFVGTSQARVRFEQFL